MNSVRINRAKFSHIVWENILETAEPYLHESKTNLANLCRNNEKWRHYAEYNTGTVSLDAMIALYALAKFFSPKVVAEVGTFIGNSASAIIEAVPMVQLHTCDSSNNISIFDDRLKIKQYRKKSSTEMFRAMCEQNLKVDLVFLDGRLMVEDIPLLEKLSTDNTVIALDDFEGIEKGVVNAGVLLSHTRFSKLYHHLIYPPKHLNCNIAMLVPRKLVEWTDQ